MIRYSVVVGVIGGSRVNDDVYQTACELGGLIAQKGAIVVCGGLGGIMEAVCKGASENNGLSIGIIPSTNKSDANQYVTIVIPTGMGTGRNLLVVQTADVLIAFPGSYGTLSEIALALNLGKTVIRMPGTWDLGKIGKVDSSLFKEAHNPSHALGLAFNTFT